MSKFHYAEYGNIKIPRKYCEKCKQMALIVDDYFMCCDSLVEHEKPFEVKKMCVAFPYRKIPSKKDQEYILSHQDNRCLYCHHFFGDFVKRGNRLVCLKLNWDHMVPFSYSQNNYQSNFCAACHVCNGIKNSLMFQTLEEAQIHIKNSWREKGYEE